MSGGDREPGMDGQVAKPSDTGEFLDVMRCLRLAIGMPSWSGVVLLPIIGGLVSRLYWKTNLDMHGSGKFSRRKVLRDQRGVVPL